MTLEKDGLFTGPSFERRLEQRTEDGRGRSYTNARCIEISHVFSAAEKLLWFGMINTIVSRPAIPWLFFWNVPPVALCMKY